MADVDRLSTQDVLQLATDVGPVPMNVALLVVLASPQPGQAPTSPSDLATLVGQRLAAVPRLSQRLDDTAGRRLRWTHDDGFDLAHHVVVSLCPSGPPDDGDPLVALAADAVTQPLPRDRPLWRVVVASAPDGRIGVVVVMHHVIADGIGGLALLTGVMDPPTADAETPAPPARQPRRTPPPAPRSPWHPPTAPRTSLNRPTGPHRRAAVCRVPLAPVLAAARAHGATVNDALLVAVTGALDSLLAERGERPADLVVSVPVSLRAPGADGALGNQVGVMPVRVPLGRTPGTTPQARLADVAARTARLKRGTGVAAAVVVGPVFRLLAAAGLFRWAVDRQRLVNTFLSNLRGPAEPFTLAGRRVEHLVPVTITAGNVGVAFAALSYAGTLGITVLVDPAIVPDADDVAARLAAELDALVAHA